MKLSFLILASCLCLSGMAQQNRPAFVGGELTNKENLFDSTQTEGTTSGKKPHFTLFGIGNLSDETLKSLNAGGKLAVSFTPDNPTGNFPRGYFASFNKNASNTDSLLSTVLVFPEVGSHSFLLTLDWIEVNGQHSKGFFLEFVTKKIKKEMDTVNLKDIEIAFNTLHYTAGYSWGFRKEVPLEHKKYEVACYASIFGSYVNIPDEDHRNFESIAGLTARANHFVSAGVKVGFELNGFQIFADLRNVFGSSNDLPLKDLKGFNSNIGVAFNTEIFKF